MKSVGIALAFAVATAGAFAQGSAGDTKPAQTGRMAMCNKDAGDKKGAERKAFMKECLSTKAQAVKADAPSAQTSRMKQCNADAGERKGDERKAFMKECLAKKA